MKKFILFFFIAYAHIYSQGLNFVDKESLNDLEIFEPQNFGFTDNLPSAYSLEKYVPMVLSQGSVSTCVGYALGYYALSTMHNIKFNRTFWAEKIIHSFDPLYAYSLAGTFQSDYNCDSGLKMLEAMRIFSEFGNKKTFFKPSKGCDEIVTKDDYERIDQYLIPYTLESFSFIQSYNRNFIENVKRSIFNGQPVISGISLTESFDKLYSSSSNISTGSLWSPNKNEKKSGGHAVCIIGYDDNKYGGSFRIVNSWGKNYGDKGYFWIRYSDLKEYAQESYNIKPAFLDEMNANESGKFSGKYVYYVNDGKDYIYEGLIDQNGYSSGYGIESWVSDGYWNYSVGTYSDNKRDGVHVVINKDGELKSYEFSDGDVVRSLGFSSKESEVVDTDYIESIIPDVTVVPTLQRDIDSFRAKAVGKWDLKKLKRKKMEKIQL